MKHRNFLLKILLCSLAFMANGHAQTGVTPEEEWSYAWYSVVAPPQQDDFWMKRGDGKSEVLEDGFLISTQGDESLLYVVTEQGSQSVWDGSLPLVVEFSARARRIEDPHPQAAHLTVSNGFQCAAVRISDEEFQDYRLEWANGSARLLVDGEERPELITMLQILPDGPLSNSLNFGDESAGAGGESVWRYIRWKPLQP